MEQGDLYNRLVTTLRDRGYTFAGLETSDQSYFYGFVLTSLERDGVPVADHEVIKMQDALEADGSLDLDWDGVVGENAYGYATIQIDQS